MADLVLDASLTLAWCFEDESTSATEADQRALHTGATCLVPAVWPLEVANGIRSAQRRGRLTIVEGFEFLKSLLQLPIQIEASSSVIIFQDILPLAQNYGLSVYDATYLNLVLRHGLPLATLYDLLQKAAAQVGVNVY